MAGRLFKATRSRPAAHLINIDHAAQVWLYTVARYLRCRPRPGSHSRNSLASAPPALAAADTPDPRHRSVDPEQRPVLLDHSRDQQGRQMAAMALRHPDTFKLNRLEVSRAVVAIRYEAVRHYEIEW